MDKYLVLGFRKGAKDNSSYNLNAWTYTEANLRKSFAWIDGPDGNNMRKGSVKLKLDDIIKEANDKGAIWCENDHFFYVFKAV